MYIPSVVLKSVGKNPFGNDYFYHTDKAWERATKIKNGEIEYIPDDFSHLIRTLERFYKGLLQSQLDNNPAYKLPDGFLSDHNLEKLAKEIENNFTPLFASKTKHEKHQIKRFLIDLRSMYSAANYNEYPTFEDYKDLYTFVEIQRTVIYDYLQPQRQATFDDIKEDLNNENYDDYSNFTTY